MRRKNGNYERIKAQMKKIEFLGKTPWIYENEDFRITMIRQADLGAEGWDGWFVNLLLEE